MDVDQGLGAAGADPRGVGLGQHRPNRGKCTTPHTHTLLPPGFGVCCTTYPFEVIYSNQYPTCVMLAGTILFCYE